MKKIGFAPVTTQTSSLFVLCLLGGMSTVSIASTKAPLQDSHTLGSKVAQVNKSNSDTQADKIKEAVATMMAEDDGATQTYNAEPFLRNAYYKENNAALRLTRAEIEKQIRQEVAMAMDEVTEKIAEKSDSDQEEMLSRLIRQEVVRALNKSDEVIHKNAIGWVYLGRFEDNKWLGSPLEIEGNMPEKGKQYITSGDVNIRKSFSALHPVTHVLEANTSVKLTDVVKRGDKGHYWAKVSML